MGFHNGHRGIVSPQNKAGVVFVEKDLSDNRKYICICPKCGRKFSMFAPSYYSGRNSCKCEEERHKDNKRLLGVYANIKTRCYNKRSSAYKDYGARGIKMCDEWKNNIDSFIEWAKKTGYDKNAPYGECTIDRIDVNKDYCPENCRWVNRTIQNNNKRSNVIVFGLSLKRFCKLNGLNYKTEYSWFSYHGKDVKLLEKRLKEKYPLVFIGENNEEYN